jgi:N-acetylglucosamine transport system substrate-binding protein
MELLRIMLSKKHAQAFTTSLKSLTCYAGAEEGLPLTPGLASASAGLKAAGANVVNPRLRDWYPKLSDETIGGATGQLLTGRIKAAEWIAQAQKASDDTKKDPSIKKFKHT